MHNAHMYPVPTLAAATTTWVPSHFHSPTLKLLAVSTSPPFLCAQFNYDRGLLALSCSHIQKHRRLRKCSLLRVSQQATSSCAPSATCAWPCSTTLLRTPRPRRRGKPSQHSNYANTPSYHSQCFRVSNRLAFLLFQARV